MIFHPDNFKLTSHDGLIEANSRETDKGFAVGAIVFSIILLGLSLREYETLFIIFFLLCATTAIHTYFRNATWIFSKSLIVYKARKIAFFNSLKTYEIKHISKSYVTEGNGEFSSYVVNIIYKDMPYVTITLEEKENAHYISNFINEAV
jgi:hypothetical protein